MINQDFWLELDISPRELEEIKPSWIKVFKLRIENCLSTDAKLTKLFFGVKEINIQDSKMTKELFKTEKTKEFYGLIRFLEKKNHILKEFFEFLSLKKEYINNTLLGLMHLFTEDKKRIIDSFYYYVYNNSSRFEILYSEPKLDNKCIDEFNKNIQNLSHYTKKLKLSKNNLSRSFSIDNQFYFCFERAKKEAVVQGYKERKPIRKRGIYMFKFDIDSNEIEVRTTDPRIEKLLELMLTSLNIKLYAETHDEKKVNLKEVVSKILKNNSKKIRITQMVFRNLEKEIKCQCTFKENNKEKTLNDYLDPLINAGIIDTNNINNLQSFIFEINGFSRTIKIDKTDSEHMSFSLSDRKITRQKREEIKNALKEDFGIDIDIAYNREGTPQEKEELLQNLIGKSLSSLSIQELKVYDEVQKLDLLLKKEELRYFCRDERLVVNIAKDGKCPNCGGELKKIVPKETIEFDKNKLGDYLLKKFKAIYGEKNVSCSTIIPKEKTKNVFNLKVPETEICIYIDFGGRKKKYLEQKEKSIIPTVRVIIDKKPGIQDSSLNSELFLYNLLFEDNNKIKKEIKGGSINSFNQTLNTISENSYKELEKVSNKTLKIDGDKFEDLCFPIIKKCIYGFHKWGVEKKGKSVPDGIYGIGTGDDKKENFSLIYDCKYSDSTVNLDAELKKQGRDYIKRTNQSKDLKSFSGELSAYMLITTGVNNTQFDNYTEHLFKLLSWKKGKVILLNLNNLLYLFNKFKENQTIEGTFSLAFGFAFSRFVKNKKERTFEINKEIIDQIIKDAKSSTKKIDDIQIYKHLEKNIEV
jgi:hypothetical protein